MKKAKQVLALVLSVIMLLSVAVPTAFAKTDVNIYEPATLYPTEYDDGVEKYKFTVEQGAGYIVDMLEMLLHEANIDLSNEPVVDEWYATVTLKANLTTLDNALYFLGNLINAINVDSDLITLVANIKVIGIGVTGLAGKIVGALNLGDIERLDATALGDQSSSNDPSRICRNVPLDSQKPARSDLTVLKALVKFLADNRSTLAKIADGTINFGTLDGTIKGIGAVKPYLTDLPNALRELLYGLLINTDYDSENQDLPSGTTVDSMAQSIVNWLLIDGTKSDASNGGKSVLGADKDPLLPDMKNYPGQASLDARTIQADRGQGVQQYTMNFYQLVNNALNALLSGMVSDLLEGLLFDMLGIDASDGLGDPAIMQDVMFATIVGAIEGLCVQNGAPAITYTDTENTYPVPKIRKLLDWFFVGGGLATFIKISYSGIQITDNFMSLLNDVARMLPGLFGLFGIEVPDGLTYTNEEMTEKWVDRYPDQPYYMTFDNREVIKYEDNGNDYDYDDEYEFVSDGTVVNTHDPAGADYCNPKFIRPKYVKSNQNIYAALVKILLNNFIDGCYFPEWAEDIPSVGAYALASLAVKYLPENNYFDRLDAYHYGAGYVPLGTSGTVTPLPYTEQIESPHTHALVTIPRAAMDIGASIGAYLLSGWQDFQSGVGYTLETDTNFEVFAFEFLTWALATYMPIFSGKWNVSNSNFGNLDGGLTGTWQSAFVNARNTFNTSYQNHPHTGATGNVNNIPAGEIRNALYDMLDNSLFKLIPLSWLPDWVSGEKSWGLFNDWLLESICTLDLQKIISILGINTTGELNNSVTVVLINLVDRILGTVFGGNAVLPNVPRNVFTTGTTVASLDGLFGSTSYTPLKTLLEQLLYQLDRYIPTLAGVIFPLLMTGSVKKAAYYQNASSSSKTNYLGSNQITFAQLRAYNDANAADANSSVFSGSVWYTSDSKAELVAAAIGDTGFSVDGRRQIVNGSEQYRVEFPATYSSLRYAEAAAGYIENSYAKRDRSSGNNNLVYKLYVTENYRDETASMQTVTVREEEGVVTEKEYVFSNIHTAAPVKTNGKYQTGTKGEVQYGDGWRTLSYEDFRANEIKLYHRYNNAIEDSNEFLENFETYAHSTLPNAYGDWLEYLINMKLYANKHYDANGDGSITSDDGMPGKPGKDTPYPFSATGNGSSYEDYIGPDDAKIDVVRRSINSGTSGRSYPFASNGSYLVVVEALNYADALEEDGSNHDVELSRSFAQSVVRLALNSHTFDITSGSEEAALAQWQALSDSQKNTIASTCQSYGLTFDRDNFKITRKSFALITPSLGGGSFGYYSGDQTSNDGRTTISLTPPTTYTLGGKDEVKYQNEIQKSYIEFAKTIKDYNEKLNDYYDNISWRLANVETALEGNTVRTNTLEWVLNYTADAYITENDGQMWRNKKLNQFNRLVTAYTQKTYDEFQRAYEYGVALKNAVDNNQHILQSLVTTAYQAILKAYYNLHEFSKRPDWRLYESTLDQAQAIIDGPLGLGADVDRDVAYTLPTLNNLNAALAIARTYYNTYYTDADIDFQDEIDENQRILQRVIEALAFPEGLIPGAVKVSDPLNNSPFNILHDGNGDDYSYKLGGSDNRTYKVITGLQEGQSFTDTAGTMPTYTNSQGDPARVFTSSGFVEDNNTNTFEAHRSDYGGGTGSYLVGHIGRIPQFKYYVVLVGDLNGDSRIDNVDRAYINLVAAQGTEYEIEPYLGVAGDVNFDGHINADDAQIITNKVNHSASYTPIDQTGANVEGDAWFDANEPASQG
ncbi:MAG: hypothetical protein IKS39_01290 [Clostridia bacterium]|nr:hypothetical protein [Clostridia bacterium]